MARTKVAVNEVNFRMAVVLAEQDGPLSNRSVLYDEVAKHYNAVEANHIKHCLVPLRLAEFKIDVKTPVGQRGRPAGVKNKPTNEPTPIVIHDQTTPVEEHIETATPYHEDESSLVELESELAIA